MLLARIVLVITAALLLAGSAAASTRAIPPPETARIDHVADGVTFTLRNGERVRIIGIDAPEEHFGKHDCSSKPAAALLIRLLPSGTHVTLRRDTIQPNRDRYDRLLRYVARSDIPDVGLAMIRSGWVGAYPYGDGNAREDAYARAARNAKSRRVGAWGRCRPLPPAFTHAGYCEARGWLGRRRRKAGQTR